MPGRHKQPNSANDAIVPAWRWPRSERARRWAHERADAELISEIRWQWRNACLSSLSPPSADRLHAHRYDAGCAGHRPC